MSSSPVHSMGSIPHIVVVHADPHVLNAIGNYLQHAGYSRLSLLRSAIDALHLLRQQPTDLLIVDADAHALDGWRLSRLIRSGTLTCSAQLPIVILARTWCERIAETTARAYGINKLLPLEQLAQLPQAVGQLLQQQKGQMPLPRLLVVEDQADTAELIKRILAANFAIEIASDGEAGLSAWKSGRHDLVLLDVMLPNLSGRDVLLAIQREAPNQPVVIMTAHTTAEQAEELMLMGAVDFLPKPFHTEQLRRVCDIAIHRDDFLVSNAQFAQRAESLQEQERAYRQLYENHHQLLDDLRTVVMELDESLNIAFLNRAWEALIGHSTNHSLGRNLSEFVAHDAMPWPSVRRTLLQSLQQPPPSTDLELCLQHALGHKLWVSLKVNRTREKQHLTLCLDNITEQRGAQEQLQYLALHDSLTGLYNRHYFEQSLARFSSEALRQQQQHALVYIDLDHFKIINDSFGHPKGDEVLREVASLLRQRIRTGDIFCRLGGDEFAVLLHSVTREQAEDIARSLQLLVSEFIFQVPGQRIHLGSSIGISLIDSSCLRAEEYLKRADIALYVAKGRGRNLIHFYDPSDSESDELRDRISLVQKVRDAITQQRILLYYQPIICANSGVLSHYETLVRLRTPQGDILPPSDFIPALEAAGEMPVLDQEIIQLALQQLRDYPELERIAINLSAQTFKNEKLVPSIIEHIHRIGVNPQQLTFELTESASLLNLRTTQKVIAELHALGCHFSIDDFGSGFSSFAYLKELPADYIKLDGSFIKNLHRDPVDRRLVRALIQIIQSLGKKAVAEYVENDEILALLNNMGIDYVQGYYLGQPLPAEQWAHPVSKRALL